MGLIPGSGRGGGRNERMEREQEADQGESASEAAERLRKTWPLGWQTAGHQWPSLESVHGADWSGHSWGQKYKWSSTHHRSKYLNNINGTNC